MRISYRVGCPYARSSISSSGDHGAGTGVPAGEYTIVAALRAGSSQGSQSIVLVVDCPSVFHVDALCHSYLMAHLAAKITKMFVIPKFICNFVALIDGINA